MNYIKLLNSAFEKFYDDDRLNPSHISLYMALFQEWNNSRFQKEIYVSRNGLMQISKIGSKSTYHRCIRDLDAWGYLTYFPSNNPFKGSKVKMAIFGTATEPMSNGYSPHLEQLAEQYHPERVPLERHHRPVNGQVLVSNTNPIKQENDLKRPKDRQAVIDFFKKNGFDAVEAKKFQGHYEGSDWKTKDGEPIRDWQAIALNWMERTQSSQLEKIEMDSEVAHPNDNLRTTKNKDYGQPL